MSELSDTYMRGIPMKPYDMVREGLIILAGTAAVVAILAAVWGFPRIPPLTLEDVATKAPVAFTERVFSYFTGQSGLQTYGPPYTKDYGNAQKIGPFCPACWVGVTHPTDFRKALVLDPLSRAALVNPAIGNALETFNSALPDRQKSWTDAYGMALKSAKANKGEVVLPLGDYGPVPTLMNGMLKLAQAGLLTGALDQGVHPDFAPYNTDYTLPLYFMGGDSIYGSVAHHFDEQGSQWGMVHTAGPFPGAWWLWPYAFLYQIPSISDSPNADLIAGLIMAAFSLILFFLPFVPVLNRVPYAVPMYRLIWRDWYRKHPSGIPAQNEAEGR